MRVVIADPPAYTPPYDYALAAALVRNGVDVRLLTSRFRFGAVPRADGFTVDDSLYRVSSGVSSSRARLAVKALEHPLALARLGLADCDLLHLQWVAAPEADGLLLHTRRAARLHGARPAAAPDRAATRGRGSGSSAASTASSPTASVAARRSRRSASTAPSSGSSPIPPSAAIRPGTTTAARCSRSA